MTDLVDLMRAEAKRGVGIGRAADGVAAAWFERAVSYVAEFAAAAEAPFLAEDVRAFAESGGFEEPTNARAWGPVMQEARRRGIVRPCGFGLANSSNRSPKVMWVAERRALERAAGICEVWSAPVSAQRVRRLPSEYE